MVSACDPWAWSYRVAEFGAPGPTVFDLVGVQVQVQVQVQVEVGEAVTFGEAGVEVVLERRVLPSMRRDVVRFEDVEVAEQKQRGTAGGGGQGGVETGDPRFLPLGLRVDGTAGHATPSRRSVRWSCCARRESRSY